ncbi:ORF 45 [Haloarcula hispanica virus SH1]|uniref:ORF 45 n=1 Tax=Haloarcula hispanica SH1 virus TaxID=326574 RepID=Q4KPE2_9VIRU|nr:ORF 45 [Haloarcula hispanica virus SH1]AAY24971.1 ORF 45 [Haloarcula hispanica virus SH1]
MDRENSPLTEVHGRGVPSGLPGYMDQSPERGVCRAPNRDPGVRQFGASVHRSCGGVRA